MPKPTGPTNPALRRLVRQLRSKGKELKASLWQDLAGRLARSRRSRAEVNLGHLNRYAREGSIVVVPGKVLAAGRLDHPISVAAFKFSRAARCKIVEAKGRALTIQQLLEQNPDGRDVILME
ncbi:MAG: 50S ribosomal protein L18e [Candidatus Hodarchaeaceae archaeon]|nr:50S ribosomal protein L18e [Candidatus Hodarchaeaceae archaeon]